MSRRLPWRRSAFAARADDRGTVLVLVLLLVVVAGLIVIPLMTYATSVLRLNTAVSERSKDVEAAKGGLRLALNDATATDVFTECDIDGGGSGDLGTITVNGTNVQTNCQELAEVGPLDALGFEVPYGAVAIQLGALTPSTAVGELVGTAPVLSHPDASMCSGTEWSGCWWAPELPVSPDEVWTAVEETIWMPELPRLPSTVRTDDEPAPYYSYSASFDSPSGIECRVFFPGRYEEPLTLDGDSYYYFASGVYYFTDQITVTGNADVVVGMGIEDFEGGVPDQRSYCADDLQVAAEFSDPVQKAIDGGGATWVFGDDARLVVDDSIGSPSIRFNQRYSEEDRGGRVSIMTVNGVDGGGAVLPHDVPMVNYVRPSQELEYDDLNDVFNVNPIVPSQYMPSDPLYTDAARLPGVPTLVVTASKHLRLLDSVDRGAVLATWDEMIDNASGGALIDRFEVEMRRTSGPGSPTTWSPVCTADNDIVHLAGAGPGGIAQHACYIDDLPLGREHEVRVRAENAIGWGPYATDDDSTPGSGINDALPNAPTAVTLEPTEDNDEARVSWDPSFSPDDVTITRYRATVERLTGAAQPPEPPQVLGGDYAEVAGFGFTDRRIAAVDANGGPLTVEILSVPPGWTVVPLGGLDIRITPPGVGAPTNDGEETNVFVGYRVRDAEGNVSVEADLTVAWVFDTDVAAPDPRSFSVRPEAGVAMVIDLPASEPQGQTMNLLPLNLGGLVPPDWTIVPTGPTQISILTNVTDGNDYTFTYNVTDSDGNPGTTPAQVTITAPTSGVVDAGSCTVDASPWFVTQTWCNIPGIADLGPADSGFQARVEAITSIGDSAPGRSTVRGVSFDGGGNPDPAPPSDRLVYPWTPDPIIDIRNVQPGNSVRVRIAGYVAVPMGRISIDNPEADETDLVEVVGGVLAGTFDLNIDDDDTVIGFFNDIVLQRKVRIVSVAGGITSVAVVQINEDASYRINSWVVN